MNISCTGLVEALPQFTKVVGNNVQFIVSERSSAAVGTLRASVFFSTQPTESDRGDFEDTANATGDDIKHT